MSIFETGESLVKPCIALSVLLEAACYDIGICAPERVLPRQSLNRIPSITWNMELSFQVWVPSSPGDQEGRM
jgi:hypothetical protein